MTLVVAFNYGSKLELTNACQKIASLVQAKKIKIEDITPEVIEENLYTFALPPVDLLIRTSGEMRISNFLLWQLAYSELYFTDTYWPDFNQNSLIESVEGLSFKENGASGKLVNKMNKAVQRVITGMIMAVVL